MYALDYLGDAETKSGKITGGTQSVDSATVSATKTTKGDGVRQTGEIGKKEAVPP
jgi:hypothetical protein